MGRKPARRSIAPQRIKVTGVRYNQPQPYQSYLQQAIAQLILGPAFRAYQALRDEELITIAETRKVLFLPHTTERRVPLSKLRDRLGGDNRQVAMAIFGLVTEYPSMNGGYIDLSEYGFPNARVYRDALERIVTAYRNGSK